MKQPAARSLIRDIVDRNRSDHDVGVTSVCSAHALVLRAAAEQALEDGSPLLVEATSNQVDQFGGYTGLVPRQFRDLVESVAATAGLAPDRVVLGGDHLGPNVWQTRDADEAMDLAADLVRAYVDAGFSKIHLDCSMRCNDDPPRLDDDIVAVRAAALCAVTADTTGLDLVIGTEVPPPGGADHALDDVTPTDASAARATLAAHRRAWAAAGLATSWSAVRALVVQPGVEFDHQTVVDYRSERTRDLRTVLDDEAGMSFEAHSTDYQRPDLLRELVTNGWAILKVGPALTFALREALLALDAIDVELHGSRGPGFGEVLDEGMRNEPARWDRHYRGTADEQRLLRRYSYSDRARYYLPTAPVAKVTSDLLQRLDDLDHGVPMPLVSQYFPSQYRRVREGALVAGGTTLAVDRVKDVLRDYSYACGYVSHRGR